MPSAFKFRVQKQVGHHERKSRAHNTAPHTEDVGVIVLSCQLCTEAVRAAGCADSLYLVGCYGDSDPCTAAQNSLPAFSCRYRFCQRIRNIRVIHGLGAEASKIPDLDALPKAIIFSSSSLSLSDDHIRFSLGRYRNSKDYNQTLDQQLYF